MVYYPRVRHPDDPSSHSDTLTPPWHLDLWGGPYPLTARPDYGREPVPRCYVPRRWQYAFVISQQQQPWLRKRTRTWKLPRVRQCGCCRLTTPPLEEAPVPAQASTTSCTDGEFWSLLDCAFTGVRILTCHATSSGTPPTLPASLLAHPGTLVIYDREISPDSLGLSAFPTNYGSHSALDCGTCNLCRVESARISVSLFVTEHLRSAPSSASIFGYLLPRTSASSPGSATNLGTTLSLLPEPWHDSVDPRSNTLSDDTPPPVLPQPLLLTPPTPWHLHHYPSHSVALSCPPGFGGAYACHGGVHFDHSDGLAIHGDTPRRTPRQCCLGPSSVSSVGARGPDPSRAPTHGI